MLINKKKLLMGCFSIYNKSIDATIFRVPQAFFRIAVGTMYSAFTGKDAVLSFVIYATLDKNYLSNEITFPIKPMESPKLISLLTGVIDNVFGSVLNITDRKGNICKDFMKLMDELFDLFADYLLAFDNIEKNEGILEIFPSQTSLFREIQPRKYVWES